MGVLSVPLATKYDNPDHLIYNIGLLSGWMCFETQGGESEWGGLAGRVLSAVYFNKEKMQQWLASSNG